MYTVMCIVCIILKGLFLTTMFISCQNILFDSIYMNKTYSYVRDLSTISEGIVIIDPATRSESMMFIVSKQNFTVNVYQVCKE